MVPGLRRSACARKVLVVEASYRASPPGAPGNRLDSEGHKEQGERQQLLSLPAGVLGR